MLKKSSTAWVVRVGFALLLLAVGVGVGLEFRTGEDRDTISVTMNTWSCEPDTDIERMNAGTVPDGCEPLEMDGTVSLKTHVAGKVDYDESWTDVSITGHSTVVDNVPVDGGDVFFRLPIAPDTARIVTNRPFHGPIGYAGVSRRYEGGERGAEGFTPIDDEEVKIDVLFIRSGFEPVMGSRITLVHWACPGSVDAFDIDTCTPRDAEPYLYAGPRNEEDVLARIPMYAIDGQTMTFTDLDPVTYTFGARDAGYAGASISQRTLIIPEDAPQESSANEFLPTEPGGKYANFSVPISAERPAWTFNVYEFEEVPAATPAA